jgi:predicted anti-sigma-YlaC factor YlaD
MLKKRNRMSAGRLVFFVLLGINFLTGCSPRRYALGKLADTLAASGTTFASDDDPELISDALPFSLKLMESVLAEVPRHRGLLLAASSGFTQYAAAFVQQEADELEDRDFAAATALRARARKLYRRARDYGLRALRVRYRDFERSLGEDPKAALSAMQPDDVPYLYWTAAAWGLRISLSKDDPEAVADQPLVEALIDRALALDEDYDHGAIHGFLITYEMSRPGGGSREESERRSRRHLERALELSRGQLASPLVSFAETVSVLKQDRAEFERLLERALAIDVAARPEWRLANLVMQRRARWLLARVDFLFAE